MTARRIVTTTTAVAALACALSVAGPAPARAAYTERGHDVGDVLLPVPEEGPDATYCGLRDVPLHFDVRTNYEEGQRGTSPYPYASERRVATWTWTNPLTGLTFTQHNVGQSRDQSITDNGDGTITLTVQESGMSRVYGPDGELLFSDNGLLVYSLLIDTNGTVDPEDDEVLGLVGQPQLYGPHDTADRDFCTDFLHYTTP